MSQEAKKGFVKSSEPYFADRPRRNLRSLRHASKDGGPGPSAEEQRLLRDAKTGDIRALSRLLEELARPAYRFSRGFCRDAHDAEEVTQDVLAAAARSLKRFRGDSLLTTWVYVLARNACIRKRRRRAGEPAHTLSIEAPPVGQRGRLTVPDPRANPQLDLERRELRAALQDAIAALPPAQREVLILRDVEGLSARRVAGVLGVGERAVKSRLHRARLSLRARLAGLMGVTPVIPSRGARLRPGVAMATLRSRCPDVPMHLSRYLEGELSAGTCRSLERHVSQCEACREACASLQAVLRLCRHSAPTIRVTKAREAARRAVRGVPQPQAR
jgi:RNA polymerase sigma-70 factor, ECF subfamily